MERPAASAKAASVWQKLSNIVTLLAVAMFLTHAVAAQGLLPHMHVHTDAPAGAPPVADDAAAESEQSHAHPSMVSEKHGTGDATPACCGEACLSALLPSESPCPDWPWGAGAKSHVLVSLLNGLGPDGLRRPPRP